MQPQVAAEGGSTPRSSVLNRCASTQVSDEGGGIPRSGLPKMWTYLYTTAKSPLDDMDRWGSGGGGGGHRGGCGQGDRGVQLKSRLMTRRGTKVLPPCRETRRQAKLDVGRGCSLPPSLIPLLIAACCFSPLLPAAGAKPRKAATGRRCWQGERRLGVPRDMG